MKFDAYLLKNINLPKSCPVCNGKLFIQDNGIIVCQNSSCKAKIVQKIQTFFKTLNIDNAGDAFCEKAAADIKDIHSLVNSPKSKFVEWAGGINGEKVFKSLNDLKSKPITYAKFVTAFNLKGFGEKKLSLIEDVLKKAISSGNAAMSINAEGWAEVSIASFKEEYSKNRADIESVAKLFSFETEKTVTGSSLAGKSFCFTGKAEAISGGRKACEALVTANGGVVKSGVAKGLSYLVTDDVESGTSKNVKAKQLGIPVISSFEFKEMI